MLRIQISKKCCQVRNVRQFNLNAKDIVQNTKIKRANISELLNKSSRKPISKKRVHKETHHQLPEWCSYNKIFNSNYKEPTESEINLSNHFFNVAEIKYEWSVANFIDIPGEKLKEKYKSLPLLPNSKRTKKYAGKTIVPFELVNGLPEVTFLGKSNAGKSTLLNSLTTDLKHSSLNIFAKASKRAGFTKTLNSFNIGNRIRLIDTPGYGYGSSLDQGDLALEYLSKRSELVRSFLLISAEQGVSAQDIQIIDFFHQNGIPFEIVFTKMDKLTDLIEFKNELKHSGLLDLPTLPRLIFTNSEVSKNCPKRYGISTLRSIILQSCGLQDGLKSLRKKSK